MLEHYTNGMMTERLREIIEDDPVRPDIKYWMRTNRNRYVTVLGTVSDKDDFRDSCHAVVCYSIVDFVPASEHEVMYDDNRIYDTACLYSIWSYRKGSGRVLVRELLPYLKNDIGVSRVVTLSPRTEMARKFHLDNGAVIYRDNSDYDTINYQYLL